MLRDRVRPAEFVGKLLGYFAYAVFGKIVRNKGYFISRMKKNAKPRIVADHHVGPGRKRPLVGLRLWEAVKGLGRETLDVDVEITYREKRRPTFLSACEWVGGADRATAVGGPVACSLRCVIARQAQPFRCRNTTQLP